MIAETQLASELPTWSGPAWSVDGCIDVAQRTRLAGWAVRPGSKAPVELVVSVAASLRAPARLLGRFLANGYRADRDADAAGHAGRAGFDVDLRDFDLPHGTFLLDVQDALTGRRLPGAPALIPAPNFAPATRPFLLTSIDRRPVSRLPRDVACCTPWRNGTQRVVLHAGTAGIMVCLQARIVPGDMRRLGAHLTRVVVDGSAVPLDSACLAFGFHVMEGASRWIGDAAFIGTGPRDTAGVAELELDGLAEDAPPDPWRLSATYGTSDPASAALPRVGARVLTPPPSPAQRRTAVRELRKPVHEP